MGKLIKQSALSLQAVADQKGRLFMETCAFMLCNLAVDSNAENLTFTVNGLTFGKERRGDWRVTIEKLAEPAANTKSHEHRRVISNA